MLCSRRQDDAHLRSAPGDGHVSDQVFGWARLAMPHLHVSVDHCAQCGGHCVGVRTGAARFLACSCPDAWLTDWRANLCGRFSDSALGLLIAAFVAFAFSLTALSLVACTDPGIVVRSSANSDPGSARNVCSA